MVGVLLRVIPVLLLLAWAGGTWYTGEQLETQLRTMLRDDPINQIEPEFDPFAEPEVEPLLYDRVWLSLVDYRRVFLASIARLELNVRLAPGDEPVRLPLLAKFHHGPLIFPGGFAVGAARVQLTLDEPQRRNLPPRWGRPAKPEEGVLVMRGLLALDGSFSGESWLQEVAVDHFPFRLELDNMHFDLSADAALSEVLVQGDMREMLLHYVDEQLRIQQASMSLRAHNTLDKERYDGVLNVSWADAELHYLGETSRVATMEFDSEYRLVDAVLDAEVGVSAEAISTAEEDEEERTAIFDYGEAVAAIGDLPIERVLQVWDHYRIWEPPVAAMTQAPMGAAERWNRSQQLMYQISSNVSAYTSLKLGLNDQEFMVRANAEFIGEHDDVGMAQMGTVGELVEHLLVDLTYHVDGPMTELPQAEQVLGLARDLDMVETDEVGVSGALHIRAGEIRVNGREMTPEQFLRDRHAVPLWRDER